MQADVDGTRQALDRNYLEILEKTNQQLAAGWWTPFGVTIAVLTALITIGGIVTAIVIYRQGQGHQRRMEALLQEFRTAMATKLAEADERIGERIATIDGARTASDQRAELLLERLRTVIAKTTGEEKNELETLHNDIEAQRRDSHIEFDRLIEDVVAQKVDQKMLATASPRSWSDIGIATTWRWICPNCGTENFSGGTGITRRFQLRDQWCRNCHRPIPVTYIGGPDAKLVPSANIDGTPVEGAPDRSAQ